MWSPSLTHLVDPGSKGKRGSDCDRIAAPVTLQPNAAIPLASQQEDAVVTADAAAFWEVSGQSQLPVHHLAHEQAQHAEDPHRDVSGGA